MVNACLAYRALKLFKSVSRQSLEQGTINNLASEWLMLVKNTIAEATEKYFGLSHSAIRGAGFEFMF